MRKLYILVFVVFMVGCPLNDSKENTFNLDDNIGKVVSVTGNVISTHYYLNAEYRDPYTLLKKGPVLTGKINRDMFEEVARKVTVTGKLYILKAKKWEPPADQPNCDKYAINSCRFQQRPSQLERQFSAMTLNFAAVDEAQLRLAEETSSSSASSVSLSHSARKLQRVSSSLAARINNSKYHNYHNYNCGMH